MIHLEKMHYVKQEHKMNQCGSLHVVHLQPQALQYL